MEDEKRVKEKFSRLRVWNIRKFPHQLEERRQKERNEDKD
jgi:hypothetical protein